MDNINGKNTNMFPGEWDGGKQLPVPWKKCNPMVFSVYNQYFLNVFEVINTKLVIVKVTLWSMVVGVGGGGGNTTEEEPYWTVLLKMVKQISNQFEHADSACPLWLKQNIWGMIVEAVAELSRQ